MRRTGERGSGVKSCRKQETCEERKKMHVQRCTIETKGNRQIKSKCNRTGEARGTTDVLGIEEDGRADVISVEGKGSGCI